MRMTPRPSYSYQAKIATPFAVLGIVTSGNYITHIDYLPKACAILQPQNSLARQANEQIKSYLNNPSFEFDLPLQTNGTLYQTKVWQEISSIHVGKTLTYSDIAEKIRSGPRAVGGACRANPIPLVIPCHRVVAKNGLGGFAGEESGIFLDIKRWLLNHERAY
jgi:methylated-DNA-[protein]-cysteine S-methyltransferase